MKKEDKENLDRLISHALEKIITWDELYSTLSPSLLNSTEFEEVLQNLLEQGISVEDFNSNITTTEYDDFTYIVMEVHKFADCLEQIKNIPNGIYLYEYLKGKSISKISEEYLLDEKFIKTQIKTICSYIECSFLESKFLGLFIKYQIKLNEAVLLLNLDIATYRFLKLKSILNKNKNYKIDCEFDSIITKLQEKKNDSNN